MGSYVELVRKYVWIDTEAAFNLNRSALYAENIVYNTRVFVHDCCS